MSAASVPVDVIAAWDLPPVRATPADSGLINQTFVLVGDAGPVGVLQWLNTAIFRPAVHEDIAAVTGHLAAKGVPTPHLVRTRAGALWHDAGGDVWRLFTYLGDRTVDRVDDPADARAAGRLVAAFHRATADLDWTFRHVRGGFHDTKLRMNELLDAVRAHPDHHLADRVGPLADSLFRQWQTWDGPTALPERVVHGDLKISNVRFQGREALALVDLDTMGRGTIDAELGDAFRSWCNAASEDALRAKLDLDVFAAAVRGYAEGANGALTALEVASIVPGIERIALELSARFAADALNETYFGWDATRFPTRGDHNLLRAVGQHSLAEAVRAARAEAEAIVKAAFADPRF